MSALYFLLLIVAPAHSYQGGGLKNHAHSTTAGDGGQITNLTLLGSLSVPTSSFIGSGVGISTFNVPDAVNPAVRFSSGIAITSGSITFPDGTQQFTTAANPNPTNLANLQVSSLTVTSTFTVRSASNFSATTTISSSSFAVGISSGFGGAVSPLPQTWGNGYIQNGWTLVSAVSGTAVNVQDMSLFYASTAYHIEWRARMNNPDQISLKLGTGGGSASYLSVCYGSGTAVVISSGANTTKVDLNYLGFNIKSPTYFYGNFDYKTQEGDATAIMITGQYMFYRWNGINTVLSCTLAMEFNPADNAGATSTTLRMQNDTAQPQEIQIFGKRDLWGP